MYLADRLVADAEGDIKENMQIPGYNRDQLCKVTRGNDSMAEYSPKLACFYHHYWKGTCLTRSNIWVSLKDDKAYVQPSDCTGFHSAK